MPSTDVPHPDRHLIAGCHRQSNPVIGWAKTYEKARVAVAMLELEVADQRETLQRLLPNARVVKAFNIVNHTLMFQPDLPGGPPDMLIAGDDAPAKETVTRILKDFGWPTIDLGGIVSARWLEAMCMAWVMAGMATGNWRQAFKLLRD